MYGVSLILAPLLLAMASFFGSRVNTLWSEACC
jgi:hypothetical protein